ncbi:hypothetical protein [Methanoculleus sp.]|uniref:hypothetical protein n=1 Tax=Methanoculleus sp. TaxID=90427 RepID=UPI00272DE18C|nr:hypothetical protein [Methanoculleus sp.]
MTSYRNCSPAVSNGIVLPAADDRPDLDRHDDGAAGAVDVAELDIQAGALAGGIRRSHPHAQSSVLQTKNYPPLPGSGTPLPAMEEDSVARTEGNIYVDRNPMGS